MPPPEGDLAHGMNGGGKDCLSSGSVHGVLAAEPRDDIVDALQHFNGYIDSGDHKNGSGSEEEELVSQLKSANIVSRLRLIAQLSLPVITSNLLYSTTGFIIMYFAGHLSTKVDDPTVFAGISMANMFANVTCFSILSGMTSSVETLASQNNGAKNYREVGLVLQRSIFILSLMLIPIAAMWIYTEDIFLALGTDPGICVVMGKYLRVRMATMPIDVISKSYEKYLCCLGLTKPSMYAQVVTIIGTIFFGALFIHKYHWGYQSLGWAFVISTYLGFVVIVLTSYSQPAVQRTLQPLSMDALKDLKEFVFLGVPGMLMLCSEWWAYEALTLFASQISPEAVASQTIIVQCAALAYMVPLGVSVAATTVVGNTLGSGNITLAKDMSKLTVYCGVVCEVALSVIIVAFGDLFISLFSDDSLVLSISRRTIPILAIMTWVDGLSSILGGITRGAGKQHIGAYANIMSYYLVALPLAWYLCFRTPLEVVGLISGISSGPLIVDLVLFYCIFIKKDCIFAPAEYAPVSTSAPAEGDLEKGSVELTVADMELEPEEFGN